MKKDKSFRPDRVLSYFRVEWFPLLLVILSFACLIHYSM